MGRHADLQRKWPPAPNPQQLYPDVPPGKLHVSPICEPTNTDVANILSRNCAKKLARCGTRARLQREIADELRVPASDVRYHLLKAGVPAALQHKAHPVVREESLRAMRREQGTHALRLPSPHRLPHMLK